MSISAPGGGPDRGSLEREGDKNGVRMCHAGETYIDVERYLDPGRRIRSFGSSAERMGRKRPNAIGHWFGTETPRWSIFGRLVLRAEKINGDFPWPQRLQPATSVVLVREP